MNCNQSCLVSLVEKRAVFLVVEGWEGWFEEGCKLESDAKCGLVMIFVCKFI